MSQGINKVILVGNLGKDPETSYTQSGIARCNFSLATTESYTDKNGERQDNVEWHNITVWGKQAESVGKYLNKGSKIYLEGKIHTSKYEDKDGTTRYRTEINANKVLFLDNKKQAESTGNNKPVDNNPDDIPF